MKTILNLIILIALCTTGSSLDAKPTSRRALQKAFLKENASKPGVVTTKSGLQYQILAQGEDGRRPKWRNTITLHYHGTLLDGTVFQSTVDRGEPVTMKFEGLIAGWTEGLKLMSVGDKYRFYIPSYLGYGYDKQDGIPSNSLLIFDIELLAIE